MLIATIPAAKYEHKIWDTIIIGGRQLSGEIL